MQANSLPALIYKYLILNGSVSIPGFGNLEIIRSNSRNDFAQKTYYPSDYIIKFRNTAGTLTSAFVKFLERNHLISEDLETSFHHFAKDIKSHVQAEGKLEWAGLGTFTRLSEDLYVFQERVKTIGLFQPISYKHVLREKIEHNVLVGDNEHSNVQMEAYFEDQNRSVGLSFWKKSFLYLLLIAALCLFYRFTKGSFTIFQYRTEKLILSTPQETYIKH